jgi:hypothetical protein
LRRKLALLQEGAKQKRVINRKKRRGISEAVCIQSKKACYEGAIRSEAKPTLPQEEKEQAQERDRREKKRASNEYSRMHAVEESLLRSRHSVGRSKLKRERDRQGEKESEQ